LTSREANQADEFEKLNKSLAEFQKARTVAMNGAKEMSKNIKEKIIDVTLKESTATYEKNIQGTYSKLVEFQREVKNKQEKLNDSLVTFMKVLACFIFPNFFWESFQPIANLFHDRFLTLGLQRLCQ